jgi:hypothetical protein
MHVPNPDLLRLDGMAGLTDVPRALVDLVFDCGSYSAADRPSMEEVRGCCTQSTVLLCWLELGVPGQVDGGS